MSSRHVQFWTVWGTFCPLLKMYDEEEIQTGRKCNSQNLHCSWSIRMHTSQYWLLRLWTANNKKHFHGEVLSETVFGKNSAQLLEPVSAYQETEPPRKTKQKTKHRHTKKPNPRSMATQRSPVYKPTSALGLETILQDWKKAESEHKPKQ